jgi:hypothetical protein
VCTSFLVDSSTCILLPTGQCGSINLPRHFLLCRTVSLLVLYSNLYHIFRSFEFFFLYFPLCRDCSPSLSACSTSLSPSYCNFLKVSLVAISKIKRSYLRRRECWRSGLLFGFRSLNCHIWRRGRPRSKKKKNLEWETNS